MENKKDMRVWWSSKVPIDNSLEKFAVETIEQAKEKINELTKRDLKDKSITDNVGGLEIFEDNFWEEWNDEETGDDIFTIIENEKTNQ